MNRRIRTLALTLSLIALPALAGGPLETYRRTGVFPIPGYETVETVGIRWDTRALPVQYRINTSLSPVPNPLGAPFLSVAAAQAALQASLDAWNEIPTSFIQWSIVGTTSKVTLQGFDMVNELTFRTAASFTAIASSPSVSLIADSNIPAGTDIDGDGDADFSGAIASAADVDNDGDVEFPAGFYPAGTILDNDVQFNTKTTNGFRFTVADADLDNVSRSVDLVCVATHEFGHSLGLSHVTNNQASATDGGGATMFPFIDTVDPDAERSGRSLDIDDVAWASYFYPEGSAASGPGAVQPGDVAFDKVFGLIEGELRHGQVLLGGEPAPVAGGIAFTANRLTGSAGPSGFTGHTRLLRRVSPAGLFFSGDPSHDIADGRFTIPVPKGSWSVGVEAVDNDPVPAANISFTTQIGAFYGLQSFNEELWNNNAEGDVELRPGDAKNVPVQPGKVASGIDFVTAMTANLNPYGAQSSRGFVNSAAGAWYAVRFPIEEVLAAGIENFNVQSALFHTTPYNASVPVVFSEAMLTTGWLNADGSIEVDLANPLEREAPFVAQDDDFAPLHIKNPHETGRRIRRGIEDGAFNSLFLVIRNPLMTPYPGFAGQPPLIGLHVPTASAPGPILLRSYFSANGATWNVDNRLNMRFSLVLSEPAH